MQTPSGRYALVRGVPETFERAISPGAATAPIDVARARRQHARYCEALESLGLKLVRVAADDRYPDCPFVEDTALVLGDLAVITAPGAQSRRGETAAVEEALRRYTRTRRIEAPTTLDGGDVLRIGDRLLVGQSGRTSRDAVAQLRAMLAGDGYEIVPLEVREVLHLKSACTHLGGETIVYLPGHLDERPLARYEKISAPRHEAHAANCLAVNGAVLLPAGAPQTRRRIEEAGFETIEIDISEAHKAGGGLTCSSIIF